MSAPLFPAVVLSHVAQIGPIGWFVLALYLFNHCYPLRLWSPVRRLLSCLAPVVVLWLFWVLLLLAGVPLGALAAR